MKLYHYTDRERAVSIMVTRAFLPVADPETVAPDPRAGVPEMEWRTVGEVESLYIPFTDPGVVWLLQGRPITPAVVEGMLHEGRKAEVCFEINTEGLNVRPWLTVAREREVPRWWIEAINQIGGRTASRWWVTEEEISTERITRAWIDGREHELSPTQGWRALPG